MITEVDNSNLIAFNRLMQCYEAEFSAITKKTPNKEGFFELDTHTSESVKAFIYYTDNNLAGVSMISLGDKCNEVCEFYIVPSFRRKNHGFKFASELFNRFKNDWVVKQIEGADKALLFWRSIIGKYTKGEYEEDQFEDSYWGLVTRQRFKSL